MLYTSCIPVKGVNTSIIMDLDRSTYIEIPNLLYDILSLDLQFNDMETVKKLYNNTLDKGIEEYFAYLVDNELGFFINDTNNFRKVENKFYSPYKVISAVIAHDRNSKFDLVKIINYLDELSCQILQIRFYDKVTIDFLRLLMKSMEESSIRVVEIYLKYNDLVSENDLKEFLLKYSRAILIVHSSNKKRVINIANNTRKKIYYTAEIIDNNTKEIYSKRMFNISHEMYYESINCNSGLFRKVSIDSNGDIKNYLSHKHAYGNVLIDDIFTVISEEKFQEKYFTKNDDIEKCKDCQFRYMCLSNSDIIYENNKAYKLDTCNFNPYLNEWN